MTGLGLAAVAGAWMFDSWAPARGRYHPPGAFGRPLFGTRRPEKKGDIQARRKRERQARTAARRLGRR